MCLWICEYVEKVVNVYLENIGRKFKYFLLEKLAIQICKWMFGV